MVLTAKQKRARSIITRIETVDVVVVQLFSCLHLRARSIKTRIETTWLLRRSSTYVLFDSNIH